MNKQAINLARNPQLADYGLLSCWQPDNDEIVADMMRLGKQQPCSNRLHVTFKDDAQLYQLMAWWLHLLVCLASSPQHEAVCNVV
jgi:hypothetical protein